MFIKSLAQYVVYMATGGDSTDVSRRQYFDPHYSVFSRYTLVLPICGSAVADLLLTISVAISGTIVAKFFA